MLGGSRGVRCESEEVLDWVGSVGCGMMVPSVQL